MRTSIPLLAILASLGGCSSPSMMTVPGPPWLSADAILTMGEGVTNEDCRDAICQHNENTDMISWQGSMWLVHRTAKSQVLGPNSALHIYQSLDNGQKFTDVAIIQAPTDRDIRDPSFYIVGDQLFLKALTRLPMTTTRDSDVDTIAVAFSSVDGVNWTAQGQIGPETWSFWRVKQAGDTYYSAAYEDGDLDVKLFSSKDGLDWTMGADIYGVSADTPLETELNFLDDGTLVALVRMDGTDQELLGDMGRLRTNVCIAQPPYTSFTCPSVLDGYRMDGPLGFFWQSRLFVVARKHLQPDLRKRTALYELTGDIEGGNPMVTEWGELPSAGDTSYAGMVMVDDHRALVSWYSSDVQDDENWVLGMIDASNIWTGVIDLSQLQ